MIIKRKSVVTGVVRSLDIPVNPEDYALWAGGYGSIQDTMSYINDDDKEFILSGITPDEWDNAFSEKIEDIVGDVISKKQVAF